MIYGVNGVTRGHSISPHKKMSVTKNILELGITPCDPADPVPKILFCVEDDEEGFMPLAAAKPCRAPGCGALVRDGGGYCVRHKVKKESGFTKQLSRHERGYGYHWEKLRVVILRRDAGLCQPCKAAGRLTPGKIVDHIKPKAEGGDDDMDNLQVICKPCHTMKTAVESSRGGGRVQYEPEWLPSPVVLVTVVCGPPGSGKSTYVRERAGSNELVLDTDVIAADMFKLPMYHSDMEQMMAAIRYRNKLLAGLAETDCGYVKAWLIVTAGTMAKREFWRKKYGELIVMDTPKRVCMERVRNDQRRPPATRQRVIDAILNWS